MEDGPINASILVIDDDADILVASRVILSQRFTNIQTIKSPLELEGLLKTDFDFDVVFLDMNFTSGKTSGKEGLKWLTRINERFPDRPVIMLTAYGSIGLAVAAMKLGAFDFVVKPWNNDALEQTVIAALGQRHKQEITDSNPKDDSAGHLLQSLVFGSASMQDVICLADRIAETDANVLIYGESGTGKELLARYIHERSNRSGREFVNVDLSTIPITLFESTLFGHRKGAFTDAVEHVAGKLSMAENSTLFLDEISELPIVVQPKLLTVLQSRRVTPIGSNDSIPINFRLISATKYEVADLVRRNLFRQDLYFRLNTVEITIPALRDRPEDIPLLSEFFLRHYREKYRRKDLLISENAMEFLVNQDWPGNVRQLQNLIERAIILTQDQILSPTHFIRLQHTREVEDQKVNLELIERDAILKAIRKHGGNLKRASEELGLGRSTLYRKLKRYGL